MPGLGLVTYLRVTGKQRENTQVHAGQLPPSQTLFHLYPQPMGWCPHTYNRSSTLTWSSLDTPLYTCPDVCFASLLCVSQSRQVASHVSCLNLQSLSWVCVYVCVCPSVCTCVLKYRQEVCVRSSQGCLCGLFSKEMGVCVWLFGKSQAPLPLGSPPLVGTGGCPT